MIDHGPTIVPAGTMAGDPFLVVPAHAFTRYNSQASTGAILTSPGYAGGTSYDAVMTGLFLPLGQTLSRVVFYVKGDALVTLQCQVQRALAADGSAAQQVVVSTALTATNQTITVNAAPMPFVQDVTHILTLSVEFLASTTPTSRFTSCVLYA
jgi:hypothetical protein